MSILIVLTAVEVVKEDTSEQLSRAEMQKYSQYDSWIQTLMFPAISFHSLRCFLAFTDIM